MPAPLNLSEKKMGERATISFHDNGFLGRTAMNPTAQADTQSTFKWSRVAWLPILLLLAAIIAARIAGLSESYRSDTLTLILSFVFYTLVSLGTLYLIGRSFLVSGSPGLLLLECGVVLWSLAGTVGDFVSHGGANVNVTIFNIGILLSGLCHLAGAILGLSPQRVLRMKPVWLGASCAAALGALWSVSQAALSGWLPVFFIPGHGGTLVRYAVLISAIAMFVLSAGVLHANQRTARLPFTSWYKLALLMLAVGLFGIMIQLSLGSVVNWLSRTAQWLGGLYLLFAAFASLRESNLPLFPTEKKSHPAYYRDAIAVAVVLAAAAIRLAFLSAMGTHSPYVVFFPAVMFAAIYGGLRSGLLATVMSTILVDYFWIDPVNQLKIGDLSDQLSIVIFLLSGGMVSWITDSMHRARARASEAEAAALLAAEREKTTEALYESRAKLESALASMTDAVFITDAQGRLLHFNDAFATYHRFASKDQCSKTLSDYPDILDLSLPDGTLVPLGMWVVPRALRGETATNAEYTVRRKDSGETWVGSYSFAPIRDKDGVIVGSVVVGRDITEQKRAEEALKTAYDDLDKRVQERTSELSKVVEMLRAENIQRKRLEEVLRESENQVRFFASQCLTAQETERKRIAGELHDSIAASISAMKFRIENIADEMKQANGPLESLEDVASKLMEINNEVRRIMADLRPAILDDLGITPAIDWFCREYQKIYPHISVEKQVGVSELEVPDSLRTPIFRILQEAMNNIAKYSKASLVSLTLWKDDGKISLTIKDNGQGFDLGTVRRGLGLSTMKERAELSGGAFEIESTIGKGTIIRASWPIQER